MHFQSVSKVELWNKNIRVFLPHDACRLVQSAKRSNASTVSCLTYHRLNGSSSPVLTATSLSYEKSKNSTPPQNQNP